MARAARRPRTADGGPSGPLRNVPPPSERWPRASGGPERTGKGAETTQPASRMIRPAVTLTRDLVRRRHPTGASPSRRSAPGRTLSPMPSEQKGAYGGHLAFFWRSTEESLHMNGPENRPPDAPRVEPRSRPTWCSSLHAEPSRLGPFPFSTSTSTWHESRAAIPVPREHDGSGERRPAVNPD